MAHPGECPRAHRGRGRSWTAAAPVLLWVGVVAAAFGGAAPALAETVDTAGPITPPEPCPGQPAPVGPPGVTGVPGVFGAMMTLWQQARTPVTGPPPGPAPGP